MRLLEGRVALVTGAGQGNGEAISKGLAQHGCRVIVTDIEEANAAKVSAEIVEAGGTAWSLRLDVADLAMCRQVASQVLERAGPLAVLVNNAGIASPGQFVTEEKARAAWDVCMDVNATGVFNTCTAFTEQLRTTKGSIINISSISALLSMRTFPGYAASKAAVLALTRGLASSLAADGIRVNAIAPGSFDTPMTENMKATGRDGYYRERSVLGRFGHPTEMVGPVAFLASDMATYVTGVTLPVDGGISSL